MCVFLSSNRKRRDSEGFVWDPGVCGPRSDQLWSHQLSHGHVEYRSHLLYTVGRVHVSFNKALRSVYRLLLILFHSSFTSFTFSFSFLFLGVNFTVALVLVSVFSSVSLRYLLVQWVHFALCLSCQAQRSVSFYGRQRQRDSVQRHLGHLGLRGRGLWWNLRQRKRLHHQPAEERHEVRSKRWKRVAVVSNTLNEEDSYCFMLAAAFYTFVFTLGNKHEEH